MKRKQKWYIDMVRMGSKTYVDLCGLRKGRYHEDRLTLVFDNIEKAKDFFHVDRVEKLEYHLKRYIDITIIVSPIKTKVMD